MFLDVNACSIKYSALRVVLYSQLGGWRIATGTFQPRGIVSLVLLVRACPIDAFQAGVVVPMLRAGWKALTHLRKRGLSVGRSAIAGNKIAVIGKIKCKSEIAEDIMFIGWARRVTVNCDTAEMDSRAYSIYTSSELSCPSLPQTLFLLRRVKRSGKHTSAAKKNQRLQAGYILVRIPRK